MTDSLQVAAPLRNELAPLRRFLGTGLTWLGLFLATPGMLSQNGSVLLASVSIVPWALCAWRPGKRAFAIELLTAFLGQTAICLWVTNVWIGTLLCVGLAPAIWMAFAGVLLRRLHPGIGLAWAAPLAWVFGDALRHEIPPPFSFGWMRLGIHAHHVEWLSGSARVVGVEGLSFALAACSGSIAALLLHYRAERKISIPALIPSVLSLVLLFVFDASTAPPETKDGPLVMLVQPNIEQQRKQHGSAQSVYNSCLEVTQEGLLKRRELQAPLPDLVCWSEAGFPWLLVDNGVVESMAQGTVETPPWWLRETEEEPAPDWSAKTIEQTRNSNLNAIRGDLFGIRRRGDRRLGVLPPGISFLSGVRLLVDTSQLRPGSHAQLRTANAIALFDSSGDLAGTTGKRFLVPGGETMAGLEQFSWVRDTAFAVAGYIPDMVAYPKTGVLTLERSAAANTAGEGSPSREPESWRFGATVCFDNLFDVPYAGPLNEGAVDFHLVCSNEAWFLDTWEMDQMVAFSRMLAIGTGRSVARATNSGVTVVLDPAGREVERLYAEGADGELTDRVAAGTLTVTVPVPVRGVASENGAPDPLRTIWVRTRRLQKTLWILFPLFLLLPISVLRKRSGYSAAASR